MHRVESRLEIPEEAVEELRRAHTTTDPLTGEAIVDPGFKPQLKKLKARYFQEARAGTGKKQNERKVIPDVYPASRVDERASKRSPSRRERHSQASRYFVHQSSALQQAFAQSVRNATEAAEMYGARVDDMIKQPKRHINVVIDTSVLIEGITGNGAANLVVELAKTRRIRANKIPQMDDEYQRILALKSVRSGLLTQKRRNRAQATIDQMLDVSRGRAVEIDPDGVPADSTDNMFITAARLAGPQVPIITMDAHFDTSPRDVIVISPEQFIEQVLPVALLGSLHRKKP